MFKLFILFLVILKTVESGLSREPARLMCMVEEENSAKCQELAHKEFLEHPDHASYIQAMEQLVACIGDLQCKVINKYQKFSMEYQILNYKIMEKMQCAPKEFQSQLIGMCSVSSEEICDQHLFVTPGCTTNEKKALKKYFKTYRHNINAVLESMKEGENHNNFNLDFIKYD
ncbi:unnamed protein product [Caenorhabditis brenneri]